MLCKDHQDQLVVSGDEHICAYILYMRKSIKMYWCQDVQFSFCSNNCSRELSS